MTTPDVGTADEASVTIRCQDNSSVGVRFTDRFSFDEDSVHYAVELRAPRLTARVDEVVAWIRDSDLAPFLAAGGWSASVTTWLEVGEQMASLAADARHFLAGEPR
jgi:hypothetical protein